MPYICTTKNETNASAEVSDGDDLVAQLVEHNTFNVGVLGSSPSGITERSGSHTIAAFFVFIPGLYYLCFN